jgi:hypothetical protein
MKYNKVINLFFVGLAAVAALTINACKDKEETFPNPTVTLSAATFTGKIGQTATVTATASALGGFKSLKITKYKGVDVDASFGTAGTETLTEATHTHSYVLSAEGLSTPIRFKFTVEDNKGQTGTADYIITTEPSVAYLLTTYDWLWKSKIGQVLASDPGESEQILDCEKDNYYSFNADGTYQLKFGAVTGSGGGTCDFDGFVTTTTWSLNAGETELTIRGVNAFDPTDIRTEVFKLTSASNTAIKSTQTIDLSVFGGIVYDWKFEWSAKAK